MVDDFDTDLELLARSLESSVGDSTCSRGDVSVAGMPHTERRSNLGRFVRQGELGRGGMGVVYRALDPDLGRSVAIKVLTGDGRAERLRRFVREARIGGQLEHPNIAPVYELGTLPSGQAYFAMKLVEGVSLELVLQRMRERRDPGEVVRRRIRLLRQLVKVCDAIAYAHARGVIHRDIKPSNVMIGAFGEVQVMDWGVAKVRTEAPGEEPSIDGEGGRITVAGAVLGTPQYMSPEQIEGRSVDVDPRSDVYSLGVLLYELLTLERPYRGRSAGELAGRILLGSRVPPSERAPNACIPRALDEIALRAIALDPSERYPSVATLQADLENWLDGRRAGGGVSGLVGRATRWAIWRDANHLAVEAVLLLALVASLMLLLAARSR